MNFDSKDLILNLTQLIADNTRTCRMTPPPTGGVTALDTIHTGGPTPEQSLVALAILKTQLKGELHAIEKEEKGLAKRATPQQRAKAKQLTEKVQTALTGLEKALEEVIKAK